MRVSGLKRKLSGFPLWPILLGLLAGICVADKFGTGYLLPISLASGVTIALTLKQPVAMLLLAYIAGHASHGVKIDRQQAWMQAVETGHLRQKCKILGVVTDTGKSGNGPYLVSLTSVRFSEPTATTDQPHTSGIRIQLSLANRDGQTLKYGDIITCDGVLKKISPLRNPHGFDKAKWLHRQGVNLTVKTNTPPTVVGVSPWHKPVRLMAGWRKHLRTQMTSGLDDNTPEAQLIRAVVLGERPPQPSGMIDDFRDSGTLHVFAVSGLHVGMVGAIIGGMLWFLRVPRWMLIVGILFSMAVYAGITGLRPPSVRAVLMAGIFFSGFLIRRKPSLVNSLAASAVVVLLWDGHQLFTPGFQLSYGVLLALALAAPFWMRLLKPMAEIDPFMPRLLLTPWQERALNGKTWLKNSLSVSAAAWMGSAPLMWIHFGIFTPIAVFASVLLVPLVFCILAMAMLGIACGSLWAPAGVTVNRTNAWLAKATYSLAGAFAEIPGGHWHHQPSRPARGRIIVFDLPHGGGANFLDLGGGILLDCGRRDHFYRHVMPTLNYLGAKPDSLIVSHADAKHSGAMSRCLVHFQPKQALIPRTSQLSKTYREFLAESNDRHCRLVIPRRRQRFGIEPGVWLETLHAPAGLAGKGKADDSGLVLKLHWHGWKILFMGDAGFVTETRLLNSGQDLRADVIVTGRNRDDFTGMEDFYRAVAPSAIITSNCGFPACEHIPDSWRDSTKRLGIRVFDQQRSGAVTMTIDGGTLLLTPMLDTSAPMRIRK